MNNLLSTNLATLFGRILLAVIFILAGYNKLKGYPAAAPYMEANGVPGAFLPLVIATELGGGLLILMGFQTRLVALALAGFTLAAGILFHNKFGDQAQLTQFLKNLSITGGFLMLYAHGAGAWSLDGRKSRSM